MKRHGGRLLKGGTGIPAPAGAIDTPTRNRTKARRASEDPANAREEAAPTGERSILETIGDVLHDNVDESSGQVLDTGYRPIVAFGRHLVHEKGLGFRLDNRNPRTEHMRKCLGTVIDEGLTGLGERLFDDPMWCTYWQEGDARALLAETDPARFRWGPATGLLDFALADFPLVRRLPATCLYLSDLFLALSETERGHMKATPNLFWGNYRESRADSPARVAEWIATLQTTALGRRADRKEAR